MVSSFNLGGSYKVVKCDACPKLVGRVGVAKSFKQEDNTRVHLSFGKGRPPVGRPEYFTNEELEVVVNEGQ